MLKVLGVIVSIIGLAVMTCIMVAGLHENRSTLPVVGVFFCVLVGFGLLW